MFRRKNLKFRHGAVLTREMLEEVYSYPREFLRLAYANFSDGIICGLDFTDAGEFIMKAGAYKFGGEIYTMAGDINLSELAARSGLVVDREYGIALDRNAGEVEQGVEEIVLKPVFVEGGESVLGRFTFYGAKEFKLPELVRGGDPFKEIFQSTTVDLIDVPIAAKGEATFHPRLFGIVKDFLANKEHRTPFDYAILAQIQSGGTIAVETIRSYIIAETGGCNFTRRRDLFRAFCDCLIKSKFAAGAYINPDEQDSPAKRQRRQTGKVLP